MKKSTQVTPLPPVRFYKGDAVRFIGNQRILKYEKQNVNLLGSKPIYGMVQRVHQEPRYLILKNHTWKRANPYISSLIHSEVAKNND